MTGAALVQCDALAGMLGRDDVVVLDARTVLGDPDAGNAAYREAHVPGALRADPERDLAGAHAPGAGRHPWPTDAAFATTIAHWGIAASDRVIVYDAAAGALAAARAWFLLTAFGHRDVVVLDGGWTRWCALGMPVESGIVAPHTPAMLLRGRFDRRLLLDADAVQALLDRGGRLLDARAPERFRGEVEPLDRRAGHIPGARNRPFADNLRDGCFKPRDELAAEFRALLGETPPEDVAVSCGSGVTACHHLLAMAHAGLPGARLYTGSWSGWIEDPSRPIATGDATPAA